MDLDMAHSLGLLSKKNSGLGVKTFNPNPSICHFWVAK